MMYVNYTYCGHRFAIYTYVKSLCHNDDSVVCQIFMNTTEGKK